MQGIVINREKHFENRSYIIKRKAEPKVIPNNNIVDINYNFKVSDKEKNTESNFTELHRLRYVFKPEIELLLSSTNFKLCNYYKWLTTETPGFDSWYVVFIAAPK